MRLFERAILPQKGARNAKRKESDNRLIIELKAAKALADEHVTQILGYLRAARIEHGLLIHFGAPKFEIKKYGLSQPSRTPLLPKRKPGDLKRLIEGQRRWPEPLAPEDRAKGFKGWYSSKRLPISMPRAPNSTSPAGRRIPFLPSAARQILSYTKETTHQTPS